MNSSKSTAVEEAQTDIREHTQAIINELGSLAQEVSGGTEIRELLSRVSRQTAMSLDMCIRDTQQALVGTQGLATRLAAKTEDTQEKLKTLTKTIDIVKVAGEDTARRIARQAHRRYFTTHVHSMDSFDRTILFQATPPLTIFVCSTTGQGSEPSNMRKFWRFLLRKSLPHDALSALRFAVFGLGDSHYDGFNFAAKRLFRRLKALGAGEIVGRGDGDDAHYLGLDGALDPWLGRLWAGVEAICPLPREIMPEDTVPEPVFRVEPAVGGEERAIEPAEERAMAVGDGSVAARLVLNERLTATDHFQDVRHLQFAPQARLSWAPGDTCMLRPSNPSSAATAFLHTMHWADQPVAIAGSPGLPQWVPRHTTLWHLAKHCLDITAVPRRSFFELLRVFSDHPAERDRLAELASTQGQDDLLAYCVRPRRTILEVLDDFPHSRVPLRYLLDVFPLINERAYSISSHAAGEPRVDLTVAVVEHRTVMQAPRLGLCSQWLRRMRVGEAVRMRVERGTMRLPDDARPVIMVGPGTGIAAFMAFIGRRREQARGDSLLFFGCRRSSADFLYEQQLRSWVDEGWLALFCAFSREDEGAAYVQRRIGENWRVLWEMISERDAMVYVSGSANGMPQDVRRAFVAVAVRGGGLSEDDALAYVRSMERQGRYQEECWY
ncbi:NAPDH-dependent diflavin reductase [Kickxella alabastrina]|uniref:NAPDH-dependent diflavin reductase n=1 Tax=Kickxella alabastrina TaxID=61397 RepID=A0ACC1I3Q4_9FUNG|nr:NAPDH-dependent diflavin reductase [Kickxella alabastrina]